jgi:ABC-type transport system substrate-binding protein
VDVQAAQEREVPQRTGAGGERCEVSLDRILDPKTAARGRGSLGIIESVQVVDQRTVRVHLARPSGAFLSRIAGTYQTVLPPEAVQGPAFGTGRFDLTERKTNERAATSTAMPFLPASA